MSSFTTPVVLAATLVAAGTILPVEAIPHAVLPIGVENLDVRWQPGGNWILLEEFDFASQVLERIIRVPAGFTTDFASIPKVFQNILSPTGPYAKAALLHDDLYRTKGLASKRDADLVLREGMIALQCPEWQRVIIFDGVHLFGASSYKGGLA